jgi:hypothetical protein
MAKEHGSKRIAALAERIDEQMNAAVYDVAHGDFPEAVRALTAMRSELDAEIGRLQIAGGAA